MREVAMEWVTARTRHARSAAELAEVRTVAVVDA
jgi:hypothetical protein